MVGTFRWRAHVEADGWRRVLAKDPTQSSMLMLWPSAFQSPPMIQSRARAFHAAARFASVHRIERLAPVTPMP
eukprot:5684085-Pyramimonas_sp.AAC.1